MVLLTTVSTPRSGVLQLGGLFKMFFVFTNFYQSVPYVSE